MIVLLVTTWKVRSATNVPRAERRRRRSTCAVCAENSADDLLGSVVLRAVPAAVGRALQAGAAKRLDYLQRLAISRSPAAAQISASERATAEMRSASNRPSKNASARGSSTSSQPAATSCKPRPRRVRESRSERGTAALATRPPPARRCLVVKSTWPSQPPSSTSPATMRERLLNACGSKRKRQVSVSRGSSQPLTMQDQPARQNTKRKQRDDCTTHAAAVAMPSRSCPDLGCPRAEHGEGLGIRWIGPTGCRRPSRDAAARVDRARLRRLDPVPLTPALVRGRAPAHSDASGQTP